MKLFVISILVFVISIATGFILVSKFKNDDKKRNVAAGGALLVALISGFIAVTRIFELEF